MPTVVRVAFLPLRSTTWSDGVNLAQVDPVLGIQSLSIQVIGTVASTAVVTNLDLAPATFDSTTTGMVVLERPDGSGLVAATPAVSFHSALSAASGTGTVPVLFSNQASATGTATYAPSQTPTVDAALLIGTGQVALPVAASARIHATGPGNMTAQFNSSASASVVVTAVTGSGTPAPGAGGPGGGVITTTTPSPSTGPIFPPGGTKSQTLAAGDATTGAVSTLSFDAFDTSLGVLDSVPCPSPPMRPARSDSKTWTQLRRLQRSPKPRPLP